MGCNGYVNNVNLYIVVLVCNPHSTIYCINSGKHNTIISYGLTMSCAGVVTAFFALIICPPQHFCRKAKGEQIINKFPSHTHEKTAHPLTTYF